MTDGLSEGRSWPEGRFNIQSQFNSKNRPRPFLIPKIYE